LEPIARFENGQGALFRHERFFYLAGLPDDRWLGDLVQMAATEQALSMVDLPEGVRCRRLGSLRCFFNYNPYPVQLAPGEGLEILVGDADLPPAGVLIGRAKEPGV
jgi:beta-galactosidase